jgi:hypothetical protein
MWNILTPETLLSRTADEEHDALATAATKNPAVLAEIAGLVASDWRGKLARVATLSKRPLAVPDEALVHILADFRYRAFTRLPGLKFLLDELRVAEWERAMKAQDNLEAYQIEPPEEADIIPVPSGTPGPRWTTTQRFGD